MEIWRDLINYHGELEMVDDFDKRDFLSPIRKAVQDGVLGKQKNLELEKTAKKRNLDEMWALMDYFIARLSDIFGISEQITQKISNLPSETSHFEPNSFNT